MRREKKEEVKFLCTKCGKGVVQVQARHTCKASDMETVRGMVEALPRELKGKLALALLREVKEGQGPLQAEDGGAIALVLPQVHGGPPTLVHMGTTSDPPSTSNSSFTHSDVQDMAASAHLTGRQARSVMADISSKLGRSVLEPHLRRSMVELNKYRL